MMTLLPQFFHQKCSIYWLVMICLVIVTYNQYHRLFTNALIVHSRIVINIFHSCMITIFKAKKSHTTKIILKSTYHLSRDLLSWIYPTALSKQLLVGLLMKYSEDMVYLITVFVRKSRCIPMKYPDIVVSFPLKRPMFYC